MDNEYLADIAPQWDSTSDLEAYLSDLQHDELLLAGSVYIGDASAKAHEDITDAITAVDARVNQLKLQEENADA